MSTTLNASEINAIITRDLPGWEFDGTHLKKEFTFKGHKSAIAYIVRLAFDSEAADHHPDLGGYQDLPRLHRDHHRPVAIPRAGATTVPSRSAP